MANLLSKLHCKAWYVVKASKKDVAFLVSVSGRVESHGSNGQDQSDRRRAGQKEEQTSFVEGQGAT